MDDQKVYRAIGLMSGTSLDGAIDVAYVETDGRAYVKPLGFYAHPYDEGARDVVRACFGKRARDAQVDEAEALVTDLHIAAVRASGFLDEAALVGFHGQTITHDPAAGVTWQIGDGTRMARELGVDVVCDMRQADVQAGGQGAPLAPLYHAAILAGEARPVAVLNLGGVANVTFIDANKSSVCFADDTSRYGNLVAFDCGPANALMDDYAVAHFGCEFDADGAIAREGAVESAVVDAFLRQDYFKAAPPKSLDRNDFEAVLAGLPDDPRDAMASLAACSVAGVVAAVEHFPKAPAVWYVCGGGRKNGFMMEALAERLAPAVVVPIEEAGFDGDAIEAQAFAYLAVRSVFGGALSVPSTTGVAEPLTGGVLHRA